MFFAAVNPATSSFLHESVWIIPNYATAFSWLALKMELEKLYFCLSLSILSKVAFKSVEFASSSASTFQFESSWAPSDSKI